MFKLNIECTKDIDELHINFSDGTVTSVTNPEKNVEEKVHTKVEQPTAAPQQKGDFLDIDTDFGGVSQEVIRPPEISREDKPVKVADELQNFDF